jgi:heme oxygenase
MWVAYADALDGFVRTTPDAAPEILDAAKETFQRMIDWLRRGE